MFYFNLIMWQNNISRSVIVDCDWVCVVVGEDHLISVREQFLVQFPKQRVLGDSS